VSEIHVGSKHIEAVLVDADEYLKHLSWPIQRRSPNWKTWDGSKS